MRCIVLKTWTASCDIAARYCHTKAPTRVLVSP